VRVSVDAIVVVRRGGEQLIEGLKGLVAQTRPLTRICIVDVSADSTLQADIDHALADSDVTPIIIVSAYRTGWAEAVDEGFAALYPEGEINEETWVWLLRDDVIADPNALSQLTLSVEGAPMVKIAGPKQRMTKRPLVIRELGETMSRFGERMALAERELDQAQYDRLSDVLAVGETGMLVHAGTLRDLQGFDDALSPLDGGLDLGVRARLAGHRVVVIPRAIVSVGAGPADWHYGRDVSPLRQNYLSRRAWLYRRFVYAPSWALIPLVLWLIPWALIRGVGHVLVKHPDRIVAEVAAGFWALTRLGSVFVARGVLAASKVAPFATVDSLRLSATEVRKRRAIHRESNLAEAEEKANLQPTPPIFPALPWLVLSLVVIAGVTHGRWWGSEALLGGGVLPLASSFDELWRGVWWTIPSQLGPDQGAVPADSAQFVFALLGSLTWWSPSVAIVALFLAAIPLAGLVAWWGASQVLSKAWTTAVVAGIWALCPTLLIALSDGRVGAVIAHLALPWLVGSALTAHESWQRVGQLSLAVLMVLSGAPILWPAIVTGLLVLGLVRVWSKPFRMFLGVIPLALAPSVILGFPRFSAWLAGVEGRWWQQWGVLLADPGKAVPFAQASWWEMIAGWPSWPPGVVSALQGLGLDSPGASVWVVASSVLLIALALMSLAVGRIVAAGAFAGLFALGLVSASAAGSMFSGFENFEAVSVWPGPGVSLLWLGVLLGAGSTLDRVDFEDSLGNALSGFPQASARIAGVVVLTLAGLQVVPFVLSTWNGSSLVQTSTVWRTLPAFVEAEAATYPNLGTLVMEPNRDGFDVSLERGSGASLSRTSTLVRGRSTELTAFEEDLARLVATLVRQTAAEPGPLLEQYGIRFIWLKAPAESEAALVIAQRPDLVGASSAEAGQLWQVPEVSPGVTTIPARVDGLHQHVLWVVFALGVLLAVPTERRSRSGSRRADDALPSLGEETSDND